jgi:hypothetical protein
VKPTFIGIGAQKCASTWLYRILQEHPQVCVSEDKEIDFFSFHYDHGHQWYERQFAGCASRPCIGEISPSYFCEPAVPERVFKYAPSAKILLSLRDPVQRALSNHRHEIREGHFTGDDLRFEAGLANNPMYIEQSRYATHLKRWLQYFPKEQILVVLMDEINQDPLRVASTVYGFLGIEDSYVPEGLTKRFNRSFANRFRGLTDIKDRVYRSTNTRWLRWLWQLGHALGLKSLYRKINTMPSHAAIPEPDAKTLIELRDELAPEIEELSVLIGRPLDMWLRP